jgi:hypothetical protein
VFALVNAGDTIASVHLILSDQAGSPLVVSMDGAARADYGVTIPAGGMRLVTAAATNPSDTTRAGWALLSRFGGDVGGVATFRFTTNGVLRSAAGVLASQPTDSATIPVDNDDALQRFTGVALANPGNKEIQVQIRIIDQDGNVIRTVSPESLNPLGASKQVATFLHQLAPETLRFRGSMLLTTGASGQFVATALVQDQGMLSAIPVVR